MQNFMHIRENKYKIHMIKKNVIKCQKKCEIKKIKIESIIMIKTQQDESKTKK